MEIENNNQSTAIFKTFGLSEDKLREILKPLNKLRRSIKIDIEATLLDCALTLYYSRRANKANVSEYIAAVTEALQDNIYAVVDEPLELTVAQLAMARGALIRTAESFTGGRVAAELTRHPGAGQFFDEGVTTYSEEAKMRRLGVSSLTIKNHGAVSVETAYEMAAGLVSGNKSWGIATTGYAGPDAPEGRLGECYIAVGNSTGIHIYGHRLDGGREAVVQNGVKWALWYLYKALKNI